jgi:hypothetical protein
VNAAPNGEVEGDEEEEECMTAFVNQQTSEIKSLLSFPLMSLEQDDGCCRMAAQFSLILVFFLGSSWVLSNSPVRRLLLSGALNVTPVQPVFHTLELPSPAL